MEEENILTKEELHMLYISQMSIQERKAYEIAKEHLETSFNIEKSIGFIEWKNKGYEDITEEDIQFIISLPKQIPNTDRSLYLGPYGLYIKDAKHNYILPKEQWDNAYNNTLNSEYIKNLPPFQPKPKKKQYSASAKKK